MKLLHIVVSGECFLSIAIIVLPSCSLSTVNANLHARLHDPRLMNVNFIKNYIIIIAAVEQLISPKNTEVAQKNQPKTVL